MCRVEMAKSRRVGSGGSGGGSSRTLRGRNGHRLKEERLLVGSIEKQCMQLGFFCVTHSLCPLFYSRGSFKSQITMKQVELSSSSEG